jgi:hypothetical protein
VDDDDMLGDVLTGALPGLRLQAESLMLDDCHITRPSGTTSIDPDTGLPVADPPTTIYGGTGVHDSDKCKIQSDSVQAVNPTSGDHSYTVDRLAVHVPVAAAGIQVGDLIEITASALDSGNVGRKFRVASTFRKTFATAQRLPVEEVLA